MTDKNYIFKELALLLKEISIIESEIEKYKQELNNKPGFDIYEIFMKIALNNKINITDLSNFYFSNNEFIDNKIVSLLSEIIFFYDEDEDNSLSYSEFMNLILSESNYDLKRDLHCKMCSFSFTKSDSNIDNIYFDIKNIFNLEIKLIQKFNEGVLNLIKDDNPDNILEIIFNNFSINNMITAKSILQIFQIGFEKDRKKYSLLDIENIMKRFDINHDCKITKNEFLNIFYLPININKNSKLNANESNSIQYENNQCLKNSRSTNNSVFSNSIKKDLYYNSTNSNISNNNKYIINSENSSSNNIKLENTTNNVYNKKYKNKKINQINSKKELTEINENNFKEESPSSNVSNLINNSEPLIQNNINYYSSISQINNFLLVLMNIEFSIEQNKIEISSKSDFIVENIFKIFESKTKKNMISLSNMKKGLIDFGLNPSDDDVYLIMKRFDLTLKGYISYPEFFDMITPYKKESRDQVELKNQDYSITTISPETYNNLSTLFKFFIDYENQIENMKKSIQNINDADYQNFFACIDKEQKGYITIDDFYIYLSNNLNKRPKKNKCDLLFIRLDRNRNGKVELWEFLNEIKYSFD